MKKPAAPQPNRPDGAIKALMLQITLGSLIAIVALLLYTSVSYFYQRAMFDGWYLDMPWYDEPATILTSY